MSIIIVGGGITGTTLTLAISQLTKGQLQVHLIEAVMPDESSHPSFTSRPIALAQGTCQQLNHIGIKQLLKKCMTAINTVHISDRGHSGFVTFDAEDYSLDALGQVIELHDIRIRLFQLMKEKPSITIHCPAKVVDFTRTEEIVIVTLDSGIQLTGQLIVAAEGSQSSIGTACGIIWYKYDYKQAAIITNVSTSIAHEGRAFERFTENGPLAMLPISHGLSSLVWCHPINKINEIMSWPDDRFCYELQKVFGWRLGRIIRTDKRLVYPLTLSIASRFISHRIVLVGNSAQTLHPIAGQGFNLGLRDAMSLAETLAQAWETKKDCGAWSILCQYQIRRQVDKEATINLTDGLVRIFANHWIPLIIGRNLGMTAMELFIPLRNMLAWRTLGWVSR